MKLILIRHAQSVRNAAFKGGTFYKEGDPKLGLPNHVLGLTEQGRGQAEKVARHLYEKKGDLPICILHSGYARAQETATIIKNILIGQAHGNDLSYNVDLEQDHLLRERDAGYAFEMHEGEAGTHFPFLENYWKFEGKWFSVPPGGESYIQVMDRVSLFLQKIASNQDYKDKTIYAVSHGGTMRAFQMVIEKIPFVEADKLVEEPKNCATASYEYTRGKWGRC